MQALCNQCQLAVAARPIPEAKARRAASAASLLAIGLMKGSREREEEAATMSSGERQLKKVPRSSILPMRGWTGSLGGGIWGV